MALFGSLFGVNITEFRSVHENPYISTRMEILSKQLLHADHEFESTPKSEIRKRFHILKRQHEILQEITHLDFIRRVRIETEYKDLLKQLENVHKESRQKFSVYQKDVENRFKDAASMKNFNPEHLVLIKRQHDEAKMKLAEFHGSIKGLTSEINKFRGTMKDGSKLDLRGGKVVFYNA
jgi:hypothetical protein